jgi:chorismate mutase/prephenate dehydratase
MDDSKIELAAGAARVAFLGPRATFTHSAALAFFGAGADYHPVSRIEWVFDAVERGEATDGVVPIENSTEGAVRQTLDRFMTSPLHVRGEICLPIQQSLLAPATDTSIRRVVSHPQALAQCLGWLHANLPEAVLVEVSSTAVAAAEAAARDDTAAIGGVLLAAEHRLTVVVDNVADRDSNQTRFWVIGQADCAPVSESKTALWFAVAHRPGSLFSCLRHFADCGVNMTRIESRPALERSWEYIFFIEIQGHRLDAPVADALGRIEVDADEVRILGSYPAASLPG